MDKNYEKRKKEEIAVFRYGVISDFVNGSEMDRKEKKILIKQKCAWKWKIPYSEKTQISKNTLFKWIRDYKNSGNTLKSLFPKTRSDQGESRALDQDTCLALKNLRKDNMPETAIGQLIKEMENRNLVTPGIKLYPSTVYRFLNANGIMKSINIKPVDRRRFEAELSNDLWQSDVMHGPYIVYNGKQRKTYLIAIIDDHSRLIIFAQFYLSETLVSYLDVFYHALLKRGLPRKLYVDNGAAFRSHKLQYVTAKLNVTLIHAKPYQPQGKGKIERWFKTVRSMFIPGFRGQTLDELNLALSCWIDGEYHVRKHGSTGQTPFERFTKNLHCIRSAPSDLMDSFRTVARRRVNKDRTIVLNNLLFEGPVQLIGKRVDLHYHDSDPDQVEVKWNHQSYGLLHKVSLHVNSRVKRDKNNNPVIQGEGSRIYSTGNLFETGKGSE